MRVVSIGRAVKRYSVVPFATNRRSATDREARIVGYSVSNQARRSSWDMADTLSAVGGSMRYASIVLGRYFILPFPV
jgi:hypothetical protein